MKGINDFFYKAGKKDVIVSTTISLVIAFKALEYAFDNIVFFLIEVLLIIFIIVIAITRWRLSGL